MGKHRILTDHEKEKACKDAENIIGITIPSNVVDSEAYQRWEELNQHPILNEKKWIKTSDGRKISLGTIANRLRIMIQDLPEQEQRTILAKRTIFNSIMSKRTVWAQKAFNRREEVFGGNQSKIKGILSKFGGVQKEMIELFGRMFTAKEVHEVTIKQFGIPCSLSAIVTFRERNTDEINKRIEEHKRTFSDIRLGYKRSRLEELVWIYSTRKRVYELSKKGDDHRLLLMTLEQIRKEVEGDSLRIDGNLNANIEVTIQNHLNRELFVNFPLKEIIVARVAAKLNISAEKLLTEMNKSYYNNFLNKDDGQEELPAYPSLQTYDFDRIRRINIQQDQQKLLEGNKIVKISSEKKSEAASIKDLLLAKLKNKTENINYVKNSLDGIFVDKANRNSTKK